MKVQPLVTAFDGDKIKGGYVVFDVIRKFKPDFAVFQGDMIYADNAIPATKEIPAEVGGIAVAILIRTQRD